MDKNITMKDIAKQAGVSVATVSYVINNRTDQRISEDTRKKILQIVNLLDYIPNSSAKSLATNKTSLIALYTTPEISLLKRSEQLLVVEVLSKVLKDRGYHLIFKYFDDIEKQNQVDAILCYDVSNESFRRIGDKNLIPVLAIDTLVDVPWFFQVCADYHWMKEVADQRFGKDNYTFLSLQPNNETLKQSICDTFAHAMFVDDIKDMLHSQSAKLNILYHQLPLHAFLEGQENKLYIPSKYQERLEKICDCIEYAINRVPDLEHLYQI